MGTLTNNQKQVILSGILGDGSLLENGRIIFKSVEKEYLEYKKDLLGDLSNEVKKVPNNGFLKGFIYVLAAKATDYGKKVFDYSVEEILQELDDLGIAMWIYDDGSLHLKKNFYNICTHSYLEKEQEVFIDFLKKYNIYPKIRKEVKKDGRIFYYLAVSRHEGAFEINGILKKNYVNCYNYKLWSSEEYALYKEALKYKEFRQMNGHQRPYFLRKLKSS